jgi:methyl-accepting chemotaxis protein
MMRKSLWLLILATFVVLALILIPVIGYAQPPAEASMEPKPGVVPALNVWGYIINPLFVFLGVLVASYFSYRKTKSISDRERAKVRQEREGMDSAVLKSILELKDTLTEKQNRLDIAIERQGQTLHHINLQTTKTNGRVDKLEEQATHLKQQVSRHDDHLGRVADDIKELKDTLKEIRNGKN